MSEPRETKAGQRWLLAAFFLFLLLLLLWIAAAFLLNSASAGSLPFSVSLRSRLAADYSPDEFSGSQGVFRLSIFNEVFHDMGLSPEEAEERSEEIKIAMGSPVPTATARNFEGDDPFTATPTPQPTSTVTWTPTETPIPTSTYKPTETPEPTKEPKVEPSFTPGPPTPCKVKPVVEIIQPPDGITYDVGDEIKGEAQAYDPDNVDPDTCLPIGGPSDNGTGIIEVKFVILWVDGGDITVHMQDQFSVKYCAFMGSPICNTHSVSNPYWPDGLTPISDGLHKMKVKAKDDEGIWSDWEYVYFTINTGPTPTPTNTPTHTPSPTSTPTPTHTPTPTPTPDCSLITITDFGTMGDRAYWTINNGSSTDITIDYIYFAWDEAYGKLDYVELDSEDIWNGTGLASSPEEIFSSDPYWTGESRVIPPGPMQIIFDFDLSPAAPIGYTLSVGFEENICTPSVSN